MVTHLSDSCDSDVHNRVQGTLRHCTSASYLHVQVWNFKRYDMGKASESGVLLVAYVGCTGLLATVAMCCGPLSFDRIHNTQRNVTANLHSQFLKQTLPPVCASKTVLRKSPHAVPTD